MAPLTDEVPETPDIADPIEALEEAREAVEASIFPPRSAFDDGEAAELNGVEGRDIPAALPGGPEDAFDRMISMKS